MKAKLISTQGTYLEALIEIDGAQYCVMDEITIDAKNAPRLGENFDFEFSNMIDEDESWESIFGSNPNRTKRIEQVDGWRYRAFGQIISVNPLQVDCGLFIEEDVVYSHDQSLVGEFVGFTISRLGGHPV